MIRIVGGFFGVLTLLVLVYIDLGSAEKSAPDIAYITIALFVAGIIMGADNLVEIYKYYKGEKK